MVSTDRSLRSVFVGNIPYDATEEKLKELFSEVGPVVSFRLVFDRESGKPKGYGFCEYRDQETAQSAIRNLQNVEMNGRNLRVDSAANEKNRDEMNRNMGSGPPGPPMGGPPIGPPGMMGGPPGPPFGGPGGPPPGQFGFGGPGPAPMEPSPYGPECDPEKAPEVVANVVASLPPEQMFELAKQMKQCVQTNPQEAREMLLSNPQLAYALLQALVVMRVVDPQVAVTILNRPLSTTGPIMPPASQAPMPGSQFPPGFGGPPGPSPRDPRTAAADPRMDPRLRDPRLAQSSGGDTDDRTRHDILQAVRTLTDEQIRMLAPHEQEAIFQLKQELARQGRL